MMSIFNLPPLKTAEYWLGIWSHLSTSYYYIKRGHFGYLFIFFLSFFTNPFAFSWVVSDQQIFRHVISISEAIVSIAIVQYKQSWFYPISGLSEQTCKLGFLFLIKLCFLLFFLTVAFFTAEKKGKKGTCPIISYSRFFILKGELLANH